MMRRSVRRHRRCNVASGDARSLLERTKGKSSHYTVRFGRALGLKCDIVRDRYLTGARPPCSDSPRPGTEPLIAVLGSRSAARRLHQLLPRSPLARAGAAELNRLRHPRAAQNSGQGRAHGRLIVIEVAVVSRPGCPDRADLLLVGRPDPLDPPLLEQPLHRRVLGQAAFQPEQRLAGAVALDHGDPPLLLERIRYQVKQRLAVDVGAVVIPFRVIGQGEQGKVADRPARMAGTYVSLKSCVVQAGAHRVQVSIDGLADPSSTGRMSSLSR
jgi:hypothetical protein